MALRLSDVYAAVNKAFSRFQGDAIRSACGITMTGYKDTTQTVNASTTLVNVTELAPQLTAGRHRVTWILATPSMTAAGGIKLQVVAEEGLSITASGLRLCAYYFADGVAPGVDPITALSTPVDGGTTTAWTSVLVTGSISVANAGVLRLQFAQQAASGSTTIAAGSTVDTQRL